LPLQHDFRYHTIWNAKNYICNDNTVAEPSSAPFNDGGFAGENHFIDVLERINQAQYSTN
jgi:hypothetical protein